MKNETIAKALKESRKQNALSVKEVAARLHDKSLDFSEKTIYGWENGQSQPNADTLLILCEIYNIHNITWNVWLHRKTTFRNYTL